MASIIRCLARARRALADPLHPITLVVGNEAADLDSTVASLSYAYLRQTQLDTVVGKDNTQKIPRTFVPLVLIPRKDFPLRTECIHAFHTAFPDVDVITNLIFADEVGFERVVEGRNDWEVVIVDHNHIVGRWERLSTAVAGVLDHHKDEGLYLNALPRVIAPVGSATTLIVEQWLTYLTAPSPTATLPPSLPGKSPESQQSSAIGNSLDSGLALCMLSAILIDTANLQESLGRTHPRDIAAARFLLSHIPHAAGDGHSAYSDSLYHALQKAKFSVDTLSSTDLLRKDYKEWTCPTSGLRYGVSSVCWALAGQKGWLSREAAAARNVAGVSREADFSLGMEHLQGEVREFALSRQLDLHAVMTAFDPAAMNPDHPQIEGVSFARELAVTLYNKLSPTQDSNGSGETILKKLESSDLGLQPVPQVSETFAKLCDVSGHGRLWNQMNIKSSRKQVQPLLEDILCRTAL
ncbi:hypothetical protein DFS34DRAFT_616955 [Phlyctochytrium arcticum]|nr:hypothetical protein DFS34DRAFT_616955 [Phlyctochytrium arcticum]